MIHQVLQNYGLLDVENINNNNNDSQNNNNNNDNDKNVNIIDVKEEEISPIDIAPAAFDMPIKLNDDFVFPSMSVVNDSDIENGNENNDKQSRNKYLSSSSSSSQFNDEYDYSVTFTESTLGLELCPDKEGKNCIVGHCFSEIAKKCVDIGSLIIQINDMWVTGLSYDMIRDNIKQKAKKPPLTLTFRSKIHKQFNNNHDNEFNKNHNPKNRFIIVRRGYLKIKVIACIELKYSLTHVVINISDAQCSTHKESSTKHPEWNETLNFKNFNQNGKKKKV